MRVVVIGAGVAGLAAAVHAAVAGAKVEVYEAFPTVGGKLGRIEREGFAFDTGPSLFTLPWVFERLFREAGTSLAAELPLDRIDPICRYRWPDGTSWDFASDLMRTVEGLRGFAPGDVPGFLAFMADAARRYEWGGPPYLDGPSDGLLALSRRIMEVSPPAGALQTMPLGSVASVARRHFADPRLHQFVGRYATYVGGSPERTPSPFAMMPYVEAALGAFQPRGGMYRIAEALRRVAEGLGVRVYTDTPVRKLLRHQDRVRAVETDAGVVEVDAVVSAIGWEETHTKLLPGVENEPRPRSLSGLVWLVGVGRPLPELRHHNVFFSRDYGAEFSDLRGADPTWGDPSVYVCVSNRSDEALAPAGTENLFIMLNAPVDRGQDWEALAARAWGPVRARLREAGVDWGQAEERVRVTLSPRTLSERTGCLGGAIYGETADGFRDALFRRPNRHPGVRGLYFAGGGVHPGGGVPLAALSGRLAVRALLSDG